MRPNDGGTDAIGIGIAARSIELIMLLRQVVSRITWMGTTPRTTSSHWESPQLWHAAGGSHGQLAEGSPDRLAANRELSRRRGRQCDGPGRCDRSHREPVPYPRGVGRLRQDRSLAAVRFFGRIFLWRGHAPEIGGQGIDRRGPSLGLPALKEHIILMYFRSAIHEWGI